MIKAEIALSDLSFDTAWRDGALTFGGSHVIPHAHRMLQTVVVRAPGQWFIVVRECQAAQRGDSEVVVDDVDEDTFHARYRECLLWPLDYVLMECAQAGHRLRLRAGVLGSVPVYCQVTDERVAVSWDPADFAHRAGVVDLEVAAHQLALRTTYSARQLLAGVVLLTERASLHVEPGRARYRYPEAVADAAPSTDADEDVLPRFADALERAVSQRPWTDGRASLELSGGMDSATVATALTRQHGNIDSKGILLDGEVRGPQVRRRRLIVERLGLSDHTVDIAAHPPAVDPGAGDGPLPFIRDFYLDACSALWTSARGKARDVLFTGIGGDELFPAYLGEVSARAAMGPTWARDARSYAEGLLTPNALASARALPLFDAPASPVPPTSLLAHACRAPDLLKHGQWPVNPLSDPHLVAFCHRLPRSSREGREVMRRYLDTHLGGDVFPKGYLKETFANVLPPLIRRNATTIRERLRECALADLGLVDRDAALALLATIVDTQAHPATSAFASFLWLERWARQGTNRSQVSSGRRCTPSVLAMSCSSK